MIRPLPIVGEPAPRFSAPTAANKDFHFDTVAGRYVFLCFFGSAAVSRSAEALAHFTSRHRDFFDDKNACFFGVSIDPDDEGQGRVQPMTPGFRYFRDYFRRVSEHYGAMEQAPAGAPPEGDAKPKVSYRPFTVVLDPQLRVMAVVPLEDAAAHNAAIDKIIASLPKSNDHAGVPVTAPVLILPRVLEPGLCRHLIGLYDTHGGTESGFMREKDGKTVGVYDHSFKRRQDYHVTDPDLLSTLQQRILRRIVPEIKRAFNFDVTRAERYMVGCYDGDVGGYFRAHRDNTTKGTAHRRFAVTINLNTEEYDGGDLTFPEFGNRTYRAPTGGAVVFGCSLLHEALPVTRGKRYAFLPFLYDDAAAKIRDENLEFLSKENIDLNAARAK